MISTSPAKSSPVKDVIIDAPAEEDSDAKESDDIGADFEVISASEAKDAPDEEDEESEAESEEAEEEGDEEEGEAEDEEEEAEEDDSA